MSSSWTIGEINYTLTMLMIFSLSITAFASTDTQIDYEAKTNGIVYNDAERLGGDDSISYSLAYPTVTSGKEKLSKADGTAPTGYVYAATGWTRLKDANGNDIYHSTTAQLEYRTGGGTGEVYASAKKYGTGKVTATTAYVGGYGSAGASAYVYYDYNF